MASNSDKLKNELKDIELNISAKIEEFNPEELFPETGDLPALSDTAIEQLDYNKQLDDINADATRIINNLAELYLGSESLLSHPYIEEKRKKDADYFGKLEFLVQSSQKTLINVMREIDSGNSNARMFEVQSMLQKEMRDNIKLSSRSLADIESFYKSIREDLGAAGHTTTGGAEDEATMHVDMKDFNKQLEDMMRNGDLNFAVDPSDED